MHVEYGDGARLGIAQHTEQSHIGVATCGHCSCALQPTLGVSSLDLGRSRERPLSLALPPLQAGLLRSASMTYAVAGLLQCNKNRLSIVRRTFKFILARPATVLLPSLGVSSLDLGRSVLPSGPFFLSDGRMLAFCGAQSPVTVP
jgi:hypothetical protein